MPSHLNHMPTLKMHEKYNNSKLAHCDKKSVHSYNNTASLGISTRDYLQWQVAQKANE